MATDRVTAGLTYSSFVSVVSLGTQLLSLEAIIPDTGSTEGSGRLQALARANGTGTVVWGSYYLQGDNLHFLAHVTEAATGEELATIESVRGPVDDPVATVEQLRDRVMTTLATLTDPRLARWMRYASKPPTFEAYQAFVLGIELYATNGDPRVGAGQFVRAATLDSTFTMPLLWAITTGGYRGSVADSILQQLDGRREHLAPLDRHLLDYLLAKQRLAHDKALGAIRRVVEIAPNSEYLALAARTAMQLNRPRLAIEFLRQGNPESGWLRGQFAYWDQLAIGYHMLGDHRQELEEVHRGQSQLPDRANILWQEMRALAALGRTEQLYAELRGGNLERLGYQLARLARELRVHGYGGAATEMLHRAVEWFEGRSPEQKRVPGERRQLAAVFLDIGRLDEAQVVLEGLLEDYPEGYANLAQLGVVAARQGDREEASGYPGYSRSGTALRCHPSSLAKEVHISARGSPPPWASESERWNCCASRVTGSSITRFFSSIQTPALNRCGTTHRSRSCCGPRGSAPAPSPSPAVPLRAPSQPRRSHPEVEFAGYFDRSPAEIRSDLAPSGGARRTYRTVSQLCPGRRRNPAETW